MILRRSISARFFPGREKNARQKRPASRTWTISQAKDKADRRGHEAKARMASSLLIAVHEFDTKLRQPEFCVVAHRWLRHGAGKKSYPIPSLQRSALGQASRRN